MLVAYQYHAMNLATAAALPGASVTLFIAGTTTNATIYDVSGNPLSNPMTADSSGLVTFQCDNGSLYEIVTQLGIYVTPRLSLLNIAAIAAVQTEITGLQAQVQAINAGSLSTSQAANLVLASPNGSAGVPTMRKLVAADIPVLTTANLPSGLAGSLIFSGVWNASTNSPALASGVGTSAHYYVVSTAGTTTLDGNSAWSNGDYALFDGTHWQRIQNTSAVTSVAGRTGAITLAVADVAGAASVVNQTQIINIQEYGGSDGGSTSNNAAVTAALAALPTGARLGFPKLSSGSYYFASVPNFGTMVLDPEYGVLFTMPGMPFSDTMTTRDVKCFVPAASPVGSYNFTIPANFMAPARDKSLWVDESNVDRSSVTALTASSTSLTHYKIAWNASDTWVSDTPASTTADTVNWSLGNDGYFHMSLMAATIGDKLSSWFPATTQYLRAAVIKELGGFHLIYFDQSSNMTYAYKQIGSAASSATVSFADQFTHSNYLPDFAEISIVVLSASTFKICVNGMDVTGPIATFGNILSIGFGAYGQITGPTAVAIQGWIKQRRGTYGGTQSFGACIIGDSISDPTYAGQWPWYMQEALNGSLGMRCTTLDNRAVTGHTSAQQLTALQTAGVGTGNKVAVVAIGTNDVQGLVTVGAIGTTGSFVDNLYKIFNIFTAAYMQVVFVVPPLFYLQSNTPSSNGQASANAGAGAPYRLAAKRLCASMGVRVVDPLEIDGIISGDFLSAVTDINDPYLRDNIHPTAFASRVRGYAIARAVAAVLVPRPDDLALLGGYPIAGGVPFTGGPVLPSVTVANLPAYGVQGRKYFASNGRAYNGAGTLEVSGAGTGVEVVDTGYAWHVSGTNQAVQA